MTAGTYFVTVRQGYGLKHHLLTYAPDAESAGTLAVGRIVRDAEDMRTKHGRVIFSVRPADYTVEHVRPAQPTDFPLYLPIDERLQQ